MVEEYCFVCASNEGLFLDIFTAGKNYRDNIETCLSIKIQKKNIPSTKICHKCVYELDQCGKFIQRYRKTNRVDTGKWHKKRGYCSLCMELGKKGYLFELWNENRLDNLITKLHDLFKVNFMTENVETFSICLDCRYNVDVLYDLKSMFQNTSRCIDNILNGDIEPLDIPKVNTCIVKRKTTLTRKSSLSESTASLIESDASTVIIDNPTEAQRSRKSSPHERECDKCNVKIDNGTDLYKHHNSGKTLCKECWLTMHPCENIQKNKRKLSKTMETKSCSVFLKDVLTDPIKTKKEECNVKNTTENETIYISSDSDIETNKTLSTRTRSKRGSSDTMPTQKLTRYSKRAKLTRSNSVQNIDTVDKRITRQIHSESAEVDSDNMNLRSRFQAIETSSASTSKSTVKVKLRPSRSRMVTRKRCTRSNSNSSHSSDEIIIPSKIQRSSSPSFKLSSNESKSDIDTDNTPSYTCKICSHDYENKISGLTHELTHSKKLEVVLEKVTLPKVTKLQDIFLKEKSPEFPLSSHNHDNDNDQADLTHDSRLIVSENSTSKFSKVTKNDFDPVNQNKNSELSEIPKSVEDKNVDATEGQSTENKDKESMNGDDLTSAIIQNNKSVIEEKNDVNEDINEKLSEIAKSNTTEENINSNDQETFKQIEMEKNETSVTVKYDEKNEVDTGNNKADCIEDETMVNHEDCSQQNGASNSNTEQAQISQSEIAVEKLITNNKKINDDDKNKEDNNENCIEDENNINTMKDRSNEESSENENNVKSNENENENDKNNELENNKKNNEDDLNTKNSNNVEEEKNVDCIVEKTDESEEVIEKDVENVTEEKIEENKSEDSIVNANHDKTLSDTKASESDMNENKDNSLDALETTIELPNRQTEDTDVNHIDEEVEDTTKLEQNNLSLPNESETITETPDKDNKINEEGNRRESMEIEEKLSEMMKDDEVNKSK